MQLIEQECLPIDFAGFSALVGLVGDYRSLDINGVSVCVNQNLLPKFDSRAYQIALLRITKSFDPSDPTVPLVNALTCLPPEKRELALGLARYLAVKAFQLSVNRDYQIQLQPSKKDIRALLIHILHKARRPLPLLKIYQRLHQQLPNLKLSIAQVRHYLLNTPEIQIVGHKSCFGLTCWKGVHFGTIQNLLIEILKKSEEPMPLETITAEVSKCFPELNKESIKHMIKSDSKRRFVWFEGNLVGLNRTQCI